MSLDPELERIYRERLAELALEQGCWPHDFSARFTHILQNLLLDGVRVGSERARAEGPFDPDATPVVGDAEPDTKPGFKRR